MMKKIIIAVLCITCLSTLGCAQEQQNVKTQKSTIKWIGEYIFSFSGHEGNINFKEGHFIKTDGIITGGEFTIDMNSITNTDIKAERANTSLVDHLKDPDFFDVKNFPLAKLVITQVEHFKDNQIRVTANLTIKGITNSIAFNGELNDQEMKTRFKINRQDWNINYKSKMKDSPISDAIGFEISIKL
jgi:polyisoprenoid-binding protein YceI